VQEQLVNFQNLIAVDPGDSISGFCVIENGRISFGENYNNLLIYPKIRELLESGPYMVLIEDVRAYGTRLSPQLLLTAKFIGELEYCLNQAGIAFRLIPRYEVKMWVYNTFPKIVLPRVTARVALEDRRRLKNDLKRLRTKTGDLYKGNFIWVDDRIIKAAMADHWEIKKPKPGKHTPFGLKDHSWQALGLATMVLRLQIINIDQHLPGSASHAPILRRIH
jgi:hypothetical protein